MPKITHLPAQMKLGYKAGSTSAIGLPYIIFEKQYTEAGPQECLSKVLQMT